MKHIPLYILLAFLSAAAFSCMGDNESTTVYQRLGVVQDNPAQTIQTVDGYFITSPAFAGMQAGECYRVDFNAMLPDFPQGTVYDAEVLRIDTVPVWPFANAFTDTSLILPDEVRLKSVKIHKQNNFLDGRLFVYTTRDSFFLHETTLYGLSYNWDEAKDRDANGNYVYDLFLRLTQADGTDTIRSANTLYTNAFILEEFLQRAAVKEQSAGKDSVIMRMNYAKAYNRDSTAWTWSVTDTFSLRIASPR